LRRAAQAGFQQREISFLWPASASMVAVSTAFDRRSIDSDRPRLHDARTAAPARSQSGRNTAWKASYFGSG
jgi:hypothetical protein